MSVDQLGVVRGVDVGESFVRAQFDERDGLKAVMVLPPGTYRLTGQVFDADDVFEIVPGAQVEVTTGVGARQIARTDRSGNYRLYGVAGEIGLRVTADRYQPIERTLVVANHQLFNVQLSYVGPN